MRTFTKADLIGYLQSQMDDFMKWESKYGMENPLVEFKLNNMIACKEMVESLLGEQVNLQADGRVTTGL